MADVDRLEIKIGANASSSSKSLDALISRMENLSEALSKCTSSYKQTKQSSDGASKGMEKTATAAKNLGKSEAQIRALSKAFQQLGAGIKSLSVTGLTAFGKMITAPLSAGRAIFNFNKNLASSVGSLNLFGRGAKVAQEGLSGLISKVTGLVAKLYILKTAISGIWKGATGAMDFIETYHYFDVAFKKIGEEAEGDWRQLGYDSAQAYADSFKEESLKLTQQMTGFAIDKTGNPYKTDLKSLGMDPDMVMQYQAQFAQMANGLGMTADAATKTSIALTMLGADWSSLRNLDFETSYEKMASALAGQTRAVRSLGVDISQATLQQVAFEAGLTTSVTKMNQATKAQLRMIAILQQSKVAWGDMASTLNTPANQFRLIKQNITVLARTIGSLLLPVLKFVLPYINAVVIALQKLFQWIAGLIGADISGITTGIGGLDDTLGEIDEPNFGDTTDSAKDLGNELDKENEKAKKLKKTILGFDELNVLNEQDKDEKKDDDNPLSGLGSSGSLVPPELNTMLDQLLDEYQRKWNEAFASIGNEAEEIAQKIVDAFKKKDWYGLGASIAELINLGINKLYDLISSDKFKKKMEDIASAIARAFNGFVDKLNTGKLGKLLAEAVNAFVGAMNRFYDDVEWDDLGKKIGQAVEGFMEKIDAKAVGRLLGKKINAAVDVAAGFLDETKDSWDAWGKKIAEFANGLVDEVNSEKIGNTLGEGVNMGLHIIRNAVENFGWDNLADKIAVGINKLTNTVEWNYAGQTIGIAVQKIAETITRTLTGIKWRTLGANIGTGIASALKEIKPETIGNAVSTAIKSGLNLISGGVLAFKREGGFKSLASITAGFINGALGDKENWYKTGKLLKESLRGALEYLKVLRGDLDWDAIAQNIHNFINDVIDDDELWNDAFAELKAWIGNIVEFIKTALPSQEDWKAIGSRIAELLQEVPWGDLLEAAIEVFKNAFLGLVEGLGETTAGKIIAGLIAFKISATMLVPFADGLVKTITGDHISKLLVDGIKSLFSKSLKTGAEEAAEEVGTTVATTLAGGATGGGGAGASGGAAAGGIVGPLATALGLSGAIYGTTILGQKIQEAWDKAKGGNGVITDFGFTTETVLDKLRPLLGEQYEVIWKTMEALEDSGANADTFGKTLKKALEDAGIPGEEVERVIAAMNGELQLSQTQIGLLETVTEGYTAKANAMKTSLDFSNVGSSFGEFKDTLLTYLWEITEGTTNSESSFNTLQSLILNLPENAKPEEAFGAITEAMEKMGVPANRIVEFMQKHFPEAFEKGTASAKTTVSTNMGDIKTALETIGGNIKTSVGTAFEFISTVVSQKSSSIKGFVEQAFGFIGTKIKTETSDASINTEKAMKAIEAEVDRATSSAKTKTETNTGSMKGLFEGLGSTVSTVFGDIVTNVGNSFDTISSDSKTKYEPAKKNIEDTNSDISGNFKDTWEKLHGFVVDTFKALDWTIKGAKGMGLIKSTMETKSQEVVDATESKFQDIDQKIANKFTNTYRKVNSAINPSQFYNIGSAVISELNRGISSQHLAVPHVGWNWRRLEFGPSDRRQWFEIPEIFVNWYAKGGFPNFGELFWANENGPEMVGTMGHKNVVANNQQIVEGIRAAVVDGMMEVFMATGGGQSGQTQAPVIEFTWRTDSETLYRQTIKGREKMAGRGFKVDAAF